MKILHVISSCKPQDGGPIEGIKQFNHYYKKLGVIADILCSDSRDSKWLKDKRLPNVYATGPKKFKYAYNPKLLDWLNKNINKYDLIIINGIWQYHNYAVWKVSKKFNKPYFVFIHGMLDPWFKNNYFLKHLKKLIYWYLIQSKVLKDAKSILYTTNEEKTLAKKTFGKFNQCEKVIGYGIKGNPYLNNKGQNSFLKKYSKLKQKRIILFFGRIHEKKGVDNLINSFTKVLLKNSKLHLVIAGPVDKKYYSRLKEMIDHYKINNFVTWAGFLDNKLKWDAYLSCEVFCLPSHQENFGISVVEALASKKPVLISNKVNIWKIIKKDSAGLVSKDNNTSLYQNLKKITDLNKKEYTNYSNNSYNCFLKNFQINKISTKFINYLKNTINFNNKFKVL
tara:strand:+ start:188 stop:1369 length:1182 start_codon:yes stop_codon:yes gene_type:complete